MFSLSGNDTVLTDPVLLHGAFMKWLMNPVQDTWNHRMSGVLLIAPLRLFRKRSRSSAVERCPYKANVPCSIQGGITTRV